MHLSQDLVWNLTELPTVSIGDQAERPIDAEGPLEVRRCDFFGCGFQMLSRDLTVRLSIPYQAYGFRSVVLTDDVLVARKPRDALAAPSLIRLADETGQRITLKLD